MQTRSYSLVGLYTEPSFVRPLIGRAYFGVLLNPRLYPHNATTDLVSFGVSVVRFDQTKPTNEKLEARLLGEMEKLVGSGVQAETRVIPADDIDFFLHKIRARHASKIRIF